MQEAFDPRRGVAMQRNGIGRSAPRPARPCKLTDYELGAGQAVRCVETNYGALTLGGAKGGRRRVEACEHSYLARRFRQSGVTDFHRAQLGPVPHTSGPNS
jgi:hypothetical protein